MQHSFGTRPSLRRSSLVLIAGGIVGFSSSSFAQYDATAYAGGNVIGSTSTPGDVSYTYGGGQAVITFTSSPVASVSYAATVFNPYTVPKGGGFMTYRFEVEAQPFTNIPVDFSGLYSSYQGSAGSLATTGFTIQTLSSSVSTYASFESYLYGDCGAPTCLQYTTFNNTTYTSTQSDVFHVAGSFEGTLDMLTGADGKVIGQVQLRVGATSNYGYIFGNVAAFIDPHLEIDVAFLAANPGATLTITPGVGNEIPSISAVPEPGTYALMLAGLAAVAVSARRQSARSGEGAIAQHS